MNLPELHPAQALGLVWPPPAPETLHPRLLAHLGDAVYELVVRHQALTELKDDAADAIHAFCTARAKASYQARVLAHWLPRLTEEEQNWVRRGRNLPVASRRRNQQASYRQATALEVLIGYLYLANPPRLGELFGHGFGEQDTVQEE